MAKFSMLRDEDEDEDEDEDDEFSVRSPKRRKTSVTASTAQSNGVDDDDDHNHDDDDDSDDRESKIETTKSGSMPVFLSDPDVLDCSICFEPLTIPVFQCDNGHIACSSCCTKLGNKCPSCCGKIGYNRCRAIEKVVESVKVPCCYSRHGCKETVIYCKKLQHEETCIHAPCSCPFPNCIFRGSPQRLSHHMYREHAANVLRFRYNFIFPFSIGMDEKFIVLQEERDGVLFVLSHGNTITVRCLDPNLSKGRFSYDLILRRGGSSLRFQSFTLCTAGQASDPPSMDYLLIPGYFYHNGGRLKLEICIWSKDESHRDITEAINGIQSN